MAAAHQLRCCSTLFAASSRSRSSSNSSGTRAFAATAARRRAAPTHRAAAAAGGGSAAWEWRSPNWQQLQRTVPLVKREAERSSMVNEEVVYFIFQLELDSQLQRALNYTAYEAAQQIRAKRETVRGVF